MYIFMFWEAGRREPPFFFSPARFRFQHWADEISGLDLENGPRQKFAASRIRITAEKIFSTGNAYRFTIVHSAASLRFSRN